MNIDNRIEQALLEAHPQDLPAIQQYIGWIRFRRMVNKIFYFQAHWIKPARKFHWVGR